LFGLFVAFYFNLKKKVSMFSVYDPCPCKSGKKYKFCCLAAQKIRKIDTPSSLKLKLYIEGIKPLIWRRIIIDNSLMFEDLHSTIQLIMSWEDYHLHEFILPREVKIRKKSEENYMAVDNMFDQQTDKFLDESLIPLGAFLTKKKQKIDYIYDFGDNWNVGITVEDVILKKPEDKMIVCLDGKRSGPPEDSGGSWGYMDALDILMEENEDDADYDDLIEWYGEDFDPEHFDLVAMNKTLAKFSKNIFRCKNIVVF
jgi:hypothetical protein